MLVTVTTVVEVMVEVVVVEVSMNWPMMMESSGSFDPGFSHIMTVYEA